MLTVCDRFSFEIYRFLLSIITTVQAICKTGPFCLRSHHKTELGKKNEMKKKKKSPQQISQLIWMRSIIKKRAAHKIRRLIRVRFHANPPFHVIHAIHLCFIGLFVRTNDIPSGFFSGIRNKNANLNQKNTKITRMNSKCLYLKQFVAWLWWQRLCVRSKHTKMNLLFNHLYSAILIILNRAT